MIKLGQYVKDQVTGLVGIAENRATFLYGVDRYCVQPKIKKDGTIPDSRMVDEPQLKVLTDKPAAMEPPPEPKQTVSLGSKVYDPILDRTGTATGRAVYLNGCSRIYVEPKHKLLAPTSDGWWTDELQLVMKKEKEHAPVGHRAPTGGPARSNSQY